MMSMCKALLLMSACVVTMSVQAADAPHHEHFTKCAQACSACQLQCDMCFNHCATLVADGKKEHAASMRLCVDCGECCKLSATLTARHSALSVHACECCAKCCDECAAACEKMADDKEMAACAKECRECAKSCRDMVKAMGTK